MAGPSLIATLGANIAPFLKGLHDARKHGDSEGEYIASALGGKLAGALGGVAGAAAIKAAIGEAADYAGKIEDISQRLDVSREALQAWDLVLSQNGSSVQAAVGFFEKLAVSRAKALGGDATAIAEFKNLGVTLDELKNKKFRLQDMGLDVGKAFASGDPQKLIASLRAVGGRSAGELIPSFRDGFQAAIEDAMTKGMSKGSVKELDKAGDAVTRAKHGFRAEVGEASGTFLTRMRDFGDLFSGKLGFKDFMVNRGAALREAREGGDKTPLDLADEPVETAAEKKKAQRVIKLRDELDRDAEARRLKLMSDEERLEALKEKSFRLRGKSRSGGDTEEQLKASIENLKVVEEHDKLAEKMGKDKESEQSKADKEAERAAKKEASAEQRQMNQLGEHFQRSPLTSSGGFLGTYAAAPELAMLDVSKKSEQHLAAIKKGIERISTQSTSDADDTQF